MNESALLQILSLAGIGLGVGVAGLGYFAITQELKRPESSTSLAQVLWVVVAAGLLLGLLGGWGQVQLYNLKKIAPPARSAVPTGAVPTPSLEADSDKLEALLKEGVLEKKQEILNQGEQLKQQLAESQRELAQYRALQEAFAKNREKWMDVLDRAAIIAGPIRPDVQAELKAIREQLDVKLDPENQK